MTERIYVQTNDADAKRDRRLRPRRRRPARRRSAASTPAVAEPESRTCPRRARSSLSDDGGRLLVANAGSDELSLFAVEPGGLRSWPIAAPPAAARRPASRSTASSSTCSTTARPDISGFSVDGGRLDAARGLDAAAERDDADPAQIAFSPDGRTLVVTERGTNSISTLRDRRARLRGRPDDDRVLGRDAVRLRLHPGRRADRDRGVRRRGRRGGGFLVLARRPGTARAGQRLGRRHPQRGLLGRGHERRALRLRDQLRRRHDLELRDRRRRQPRAARRRSPPRRASARRASATRRSPRDGRYLYAIDADAQRVFGWTVGDDGRSTPVGEFEGVPETVAGLAAS